MEWVELEEDHFEAGSREIQQYFRQGRTLQNRPFFSTFFTCHLGDAPPKYHFTPPQP
jgi:hypothetical protein